MTRKILYIGLFLVALASCSKFEKIRKSTDNVYKYKKALEYYNKADYDRSSILLDEVSMYFRGTVRLDTINFYLAMCNYNQEFYTAASEYFRMTYDINPYSTFAEEAQYMEAYSYYKDSPNPSLDQSSSAKAITLFHEFMKKYPRSMFVEKSILCIAELEDKLVEKSYRSAKLYYDMKIYKSSIVALKSSIDQYPNTKYREEVLWMILQSSFLLADNSIESKRKERFQSTLDEYYSFVSEFPQSAYIEDAKKIFEKSDKLSK